MPFSIAQTSFTNLAMDTSLSYDSAVAKQCVGVAHFIEFRAEEVIACQHLALESILHLRDYVEDSMRPAVTLVPETEMHIVTAKKRLEMIESSQTLIKSFLIILREIGAKTSFKDMGSYCFLDVNLVDDLSAITVQLGELKVYLGVMSSRLREHSTQGTVECHICNEHDNCLNKMGHLREGIQAVSNAFSRRRKFEHLHEHDAFVHRSEREKLKDLCVQTVDQYHCHCAYNLQTVHEASQKVISSLLKHSRMQTNIECNLKGIRECFNEINERLCTVEETFNRMVHLSSRVSSQNFTGPPIPLVSAEFSEAPSDASARQKERSALLSSLAAEVGNLQHASSDLHCTVRMSTDALRNLKRRLEGASQ